MKSLHSSKVNKISPTTPLTDFERLEAKHLLFWVSLSNASLLMLLTVTIQIGPWYFAAIILATLVVTAGLMYWYIRISKNSRGMTARLYREWRARREANQQSSNKPLTKLSIE